MCQLDEAGLQRHCHLVNHWAFSWRLTFIHASQVGLTRANNGQRRRPPGRDGGASQVPDDRSHAAGLWSTRIRFAGCRHGDSRCHRWPLTKGVRPDRRAGGLPCSDSPRAQRPGECPGHDTHAGAVWHAAEKGIAPFHESVPGVGFPGIGRRYCGYLDRSWRRFCAGAGAADYVPGLRAGNHYQHFLGGSFFQCHFRLRGLCPDETD
jgi:hypothetical protein